MILVSEVDVLDIQEEIRHRDDFLQQQTAQHVSVSIARWSSLQFDVTVRRVTTTTLQSRHSILSSAMEDQVGQLYLFDAPSSQWFEDRRMHYLGAKSHAIPPFDFGTSLALPTPDLVSSSFFPRRRNSPLVERCTAFTVSLDIIERGITPFNTDTDEDNLEEEKKAFLALSLASVQGRIVSVLFFELSLPVPTILPADILLTLSTRSLNKGGNHDGSRQTLDSIVRIFSKEVSLTLSSRPSHITFSFVISFVSTNIKWRLLTRWVGVSGGHRNSSPQR